MAELPPAPTATGELSVIAEPGPGHADGGPAMLPEPQDAVVVDDWDATPARRGRLPPVRAGGDAGQPARTGTAGRVGTPSAGSAGATAVVVAVELTITAPGRAPYQIRVERGGQVMLGRDPEFSGHAGYLSGYDLLSRRHARFGLDDDGTAWLRDEYATNPARVDSVDITKGRQVRLTDGADIQLCPGLTATVRLITEAGA